MLSGLLLSVLSLVPLALASITPYPTSDFSFFGADTVQLNMTELFDLDGASINTQFSTSHGNLIDYKTKYTMRSLDKYGFGKVDFVHYIDNLTYAAIFDESQVLIRKASMDGLSIESEIQHGFNKPGRTVSCSDIDFNANMSRLYLVCFQQSTETVNGIIYLAELDSQTGELLNTIQTDLNKTYTAEHTLRIVIATVNQGGQDQRVVVVYDQGLSATNTTKNFWLAIYTGVDSGRNLAFDGFVDLRSSIDGITSFFDVFNYNKRMIVTGFLNSVGNIQALSCNLVPTPLSLSCTSPVPSLVKVGYIGFMNTGQFVMVDQTTSKKTMKVCDLVGPFEQQSWSGCRSYLDIDSIDGAFVSEVVGNADVIMVKYDHPDGEYAGHTVYTNSVNIDRNIPAEWTSTDETLHATVLDKKIHYVTSKLTWVNVMMTPSVSFDPVSSALGGGVTTIKVTANDGGANVVANANIRTLLSIFDYIKVNVSEMAPVNAYEGSAFDAWLPSSALEGNNLSVSINFDQTQSPFLVPFVYDTKNIGTIFRLKTASQRFREITFIEDSAIALDIYGDLIIMNCSQVNSLVYCDEKGHQFIDPSQYLQKRSFKILNYTIAWTRDDQNTYIYIFDSTGKCYPHSFRGSATDLTATELAPNGYIVASFPQIGELHHAVFNQYNPRDLETLPPITQKDSGSQYFCPTTLHFCPFGANVLEVLSACTDVADRRMLKYTYWPAQTNLKLRNFIPIDIELGDGQFCPMGGEFIISSVSNSKLYGVPTYWEKATYTYGLDELNIGQFIKVDCAPKEHMFSILAHDDAGKLQLAVFKGNNQYDAQNKVVTVITSGLDGVSDVTNHFFLGNLIHVKQMNDGSYSYMMTYTTPRVNVKILPGIGPQNTSFTLTFRNSKQSEQVKLPLEVVRFDSTIRLWIKLEENLNPFGEINLEDHISVDGVVTEYEIEGATKDQVELIPRIKTYKGYFPKLSDTYTFQHIEADEEINLALHESNPNSATFTLFTDVDNFAYSFSPFPGVGVQGFDLSKIKGTGKDVELLVAFCTDGLEENRLDVFIVQNGLVSSVGHFPIECSKVKVIKRDLDTHFYVVVHDGPTTDLTVFNVTVSPQSITIEAIETWNDVYTFGVAETKGHAYVVMILEENYFEPFIVPYQRSTSSKPQVQVKQRLGFWQSKHYIFAIECVTLNDESFSCVYDTYSTKMYEVVIKESDFNDTQIFKYNKIPDYDGRYFVMTPSYFAVLASNSRHDIWDILIYKRQSVGGSKNLYSFVEMDSRSPYTMKELANGTTTVSYCTKRENEPLKFAKMHPLAIVIKERDLNLSSISLTFKNPVHTRSLTLAEIFAGPARVSSASAWPFILILSALIILSVAYLAINNFKRKEEDVYEQPDGEPEKEIAK